MTLDHLWASWRADYVANVSVGESGEGEVAASPDVANTDGPASEPEKECVFCRILALDETDEARYIVHRAEHCVVILNAYPYASGHMLIMPIRHLDDIDRLTEDESQEMWQLTRHAVTAARGAYGADGLNIGANLGRAAGAGIPGHLHFHVVPRWIGDTNFMTTVAAIRVMPEALSDSWKKLNRSWPK